MGRSAGWGETAPRRPVGSNQPNIRSVSPPQPQQMRPITSVFSTVLKVKPAMPVSVLRSRIEGKPVKAIALRNQGGHAWC